MIVKLLTEQHLEFLSLKGGCRGSYESALVKLLETSCRGSIFSCSLQAGEVNNERNEIMNGQNQQPQLNITTNQDEVNS